MFKFWSAQHQPPYLQKGMHYATESVRGPEIMFSVPFVPGNYKGKNEKKDGWKKLIWKNVNFGEKWIQCLLSWTNKVQTHQHAHQRKFTLFLQCESLSRGDDRLNYLEIRKNAQLCDMDQSINQSIKLLITRIRWYSFNSINQSIDRMAEYSENLEMTKKFQV